MTTKRDPRNQEVVFPADDPQIGHLATPISASAWTKTFINKLPAYREGLSAMRRGLEVGMAHGYFLFGPFAWSNPLRHSKVANLVGLTETVILVVILTYAIALYYTVGVKKPIATITVPKPPAEFGTQKGWSEFAGGFLVGGIGGAVFAYLVIQVVNLIF